MDGRGLERKIGWSENGVFCPATAYQEARRSANIGRTVSAVRSPGAASLAASRELRC
jgi:hypothetical protein